MKAKILIALLLLSGFAPGINKNSFSQSCYSPVIDSIVSRVTLQSIIKTVKELSGDTSCIIGGNPYTILTRAYNFDGNEMAAKYIFEKFVSYELNARYQPFSATGKNVIGIKKGIKHPNKFYILCSHYDSYPFAERSPGADDNASGTAAFLEAAKLLSTYTTDYTIKFIGWDEEERGYFGSMAYVDSCEQAGDTLMGVVNMDMLGYDLNNHNLITVYSDINSRPLADIMYSSIQLYVPEINSSMKYGYVSDESIFQQHGYKGICPWEGYPNGFINSFADSIQRFNLPYYLRMVKCVVGGIATLGFDYVINFSHQPIITSPDTTGRIAVVSVISNHVPLGGNNACRLFYKANSSTYEQLSYYYRNLDTFKFQIPGQGRGTTVSYYFTAQDSSGELFATYPGGGMQNVPPVNLFTYYIPETMGACSNTVPKTIPPLEWIVDTINISQDYILLDMDVSVTINHPVDKNIYIDILSPAGKLVRLSYAHGDSGANYINTVFDDEAADSISHGTPPFTGHFIPDAPLRVVDNNTMKGLWILKIINTSENLPGQLISWCINSNFVYPIGILQNQIPVKFSLLQNYPNPFNPVTIIKYSIPKANIVKLIVYDVLGREVKILVNEMKTAGDHSVNFDGTAFASGIYFYRIVVDSFGEAGEFTEVKKMVLIK